MRNALDHLAQPLDRTARVRTPRVVRHRLLPRRSAQRRTQPLVFDEAPQARRECVGVARFDEPRRPAVVEHLADLLEVRIVIDQPWHLWPFLRGAPRLEVPYHSIHYLDAIRWLVGEPDGVYCRVVRHPSFPDLADTRSSILLAFGDPIRCSLTLNHTHRAGPKHRASQIVVEGTRGAARLTWGVNLAYPSGPPDTMEVALDGGWRDVPLRGSWFVDAFEGPMSNLQRFVAGEDDVLVTRVDDAIRTMALVEACYTSSERGATAIPGIE